VASKITFVSADGGKAAFTGAIGAIFISAGAISVNGQSIATAGTVTINGQTVYVPASGAVITDDAGRTLTLQQVGEYTRYNAKYNESTRIDISFTVTADGKLVLSELKVLTMMNTHLNITGTIAGMMIAARPYRYVKRRDSFYRRQHRDDTRRYADPERSGLS